MAATAFPGYPDTLQCVDFQRLQEPQITMSCTQAKAAPWAIAIADTGIVRFVRDSGPEQEPADVGADYRGTLQLRVSLDGRECHTCGVYIGKELLGVFVRASGNGPDQRRHGAHVEDGWRR